MTLERYIIRNHIGPFFFSLSLLTFVFIMDFILRYIDLFLTKGVKFHIVLQTFILSLGHMFALIIPMAVLPATLMTFGNFASENEITAMKASGVSLYRMILPGLVAASLLTGGMVYYNNRILPESNHRLLNLLIDINKKKPTAEIKENVFIDAFEGYKIYVRHKNDKTGEVGDVQIFESDKKGNLLRTVTAEKGRLRYIEEEQIIRFELENAQIHEIPRTADASTYRRTTLKNYLMNIKDVDRTLRRSERNYRGDREMSSAMMQDKIGELQKEVVGVQGKISEMASGEITQALALLDPAVRDTTLRVGNRGDAEPVGDRGGNAGPRPMVRVRTGEPRRPPADEPSNVLTTRRALESQQEIKFSYLRQIDRYRVEIHKKYSIPFACIIFVLIGSPLAIRLGRSGMNMAVGLSMFVFLVYYVCLIGGEKLADREILSPVIAMWAPNVIFGVAAVFLIRSATLEHSAVQFRVTNRLKMFRRD